MDLRAQLVQFVFVPVAKLAFLAAAHMFGGLAWRGTPDPAQVAALR